MTESRRNRFPQEQIPMQGMVFTIHWYFKMIFIKYLKNLQREENYIDRKPEKLLPTLTNPNAR
jgi:hypothetical protein